MENHSGTPPPTVLRRSLEAGVASSVAEALQVFEERMDGRFAQIDARFAMVLHELRSDREARKREREADLAARKRECEADLAAWKREREADLATRKADAEARRRERASDLAARAAAREACLAISVSTCRRIRVLQWMTGVAIALLIIQNGWIYHVLTS